MRKLVIKLDSYSCMTYLSMMTLCYGSLFKYLHAGFLRVPLIGDKLYVIICLLLAVMSLNTGNYKKIRMNTIAVILFFASAVVFSYYAYSANREFINLRFWNVLAPCLPYFLLGTCFISDDYIIDKLGACSCIGIIASSLYVIYYIRSGQSMANDMMSWSYDVLPSTLMAIDYAFKKKSKFAGICVAMGLVYALIMGTRGPIVIAFAFLIESMWFRSNRKFGHKIAVSLVVILGMSFLFLTSFYNSILNYVFRMLNSRNLSVRIIQFLVSGEMISNTSGRDNIYSILLDKLKSRPLIGYGVYGDFGLLRTAAHNMYLEAIFDFGIIIGAVVVIYIISRFIHAILNNKKSKNVTQWIILWGFQVFIRGIFGGSIFSQNTFFLLGLCMSLCLPSRYNFTNDSQQGGLTDV